MLFFRKEQRRFVCRDGEEGRYKRVTLKKLTAVMTALAISFTLCACGSGRAAETAAPGPAMPDMAPVMPAAERREAPKVSDVFTKRDLDSAYDPEAGVIVFAGTEVKADADGIDVSGTEVRISSEGCYIFRGDCPDGRIVIDAGKDKVQLVLDGLRLSCGNAPAIYVKDADKVFITLTDGSDNTVSCGAGEEQGGGSANAAILSKCNLCVNGGGRLCLSSEYGHGIDGKGDVKLSCRELAVSAAEKGVSGNDSVSVNCGSLEINCGGKGIVSTKNTEGKTGCINILGGMISLSSGDDCFHTDGQLNICAGDLHLISGNDAVHSDSRVDVYGGTIDIPDCFEGFEAPKLYIYGGDIRIEAYDDGLNAADGTGGEDYYDLPDLGAGTVPPGGQGDFGGMPPVPAGGPDGRENDLPSGSACYIDISGGRISITASGDGIDVNGYLNISGGEIYVSGPVSQRDSAVDFDFGAKISGGTLMAAGSPAMAENFDADSAQGSILYFFPKTYGEGTEIILNSGNGGALIRYTPEHDFSCVLISLPELAAGGAYTISAGSDVYEMTMTDTVWSNGGVAGSGPFGGPGGPGRP